MLEFRLLGPLEASGPAGAAALGGRKQRLLLAVLLVHAGEFVSREVLVDALWPDQPPPSAVPTIESYVSRLRGLLRTVGGGAAVIESGPAGYRVERDGHRIDRDEFERLAVAARIALDCGDAPEAVARATEAVALWRGPALAGLADEIALRADVVALQERRAQVLETRAEAALACGRGGEAIAQLSAEVTRYPAREHLWALLMLALYRAGRQAEALEVYQQARSYLVEELGLEPGSELRDLQARVLQHDKSLAGPDERVLDLPGSDRIAARSPAAVAARPPRRRRRAVVAAGLGAAVALAAVVMWSVGASGDKAFARVLRAPALGLLDVSGSRTRAAAALGAIPTRIAAGPGSTWATSYDDGTLLRTDPRSLAVRQAIAVGHGLTGVTVASGDVWVADTLDGALARVDINTSSVVQRISVGTAPTEVAAGAGAVWVSNTGDGTVSRVDSRTGTVLNTTPVGAAPKGVAVGAGGVWVAVSGAGIVARLDPRSGRVLDRIQVGSGPAQIAVGRDGVWVGNELDSTVSLIDPGSDTVVLTRAVSGTPAALAVAGGGLWVAARDLAILTLVRASGAMRIAQLPSPATTLAPASGGVLVGVRGTGADHRGGTLVVRTTSPIGQINPDSCCDLAPDVRALSYDGLVGFSKSPSTAGTLVPDLALQVPRGQAEGRRYTFQLRPGLRYWNGAAVLASDVRRGLERAAAANDIFAGYLSALPGALACPRHPLSCNLGRAVIANDRARTVTLQLAHPDPELLLALSLPAFAPAPSGGGITPGTGPYRITRFVANHLIVYERNPFFREWAPTAQPTGYPNRILIESGAAATSDVTAVLSGQADLTFDSPTPGQLAEIELREPGQLHIAPLPSVDFLFLDTHAPPFDDVRVRRALNLAVDRAAVARLFGGPLEATPDCQIVPATIAGHVPYCPYTRAPSRDGRWTAPDLARARALIAASGTRGAAVSVLTQPGLASDEPTGRYFIGLLRRLGYRARLRSLPLDQRTAAVTDSRHPAQLGTYSWIADFPSPSQWIAQLACAAWNPPIRLNNHAQFCDRQVDSLAARAARLELTNPATANALWARADKRITDLAPWVPTVSESETDLVAKRVGNYQYVPTIGVLIDQLWIH